MRSREEPFGQPPGLLCVRLVGDVVVFEHCPGPVARDLHDHTFGDAGSPQIANGCPAKVMEEQVWNFRSFARLSPTLPKVLNRPCTRAKR